ncbi:hypothetical protein BH09BAC2_BH09BAC2_00770 [soil metagenome]
MKKSLIIFLFVLIGITDQSCRSTKKFKTAINKKDTTIIAAGSSYADSLAVIHYVQTGIANNKIDFTTFSAKVKIEYEDSKGKQPDVIAFVRMYKDSVIWASINATFLNIEAFRILITKDSIFILNKLDKEISYKSINYLEQVAHIPFDFRTLQDLIIGNPIYYGDSVVSFKKTENRILLSTIGPFFKNLMTLSADNNLIDRIKLDDLNVSLNRTADITYQNYAPLDGKNFSTYRELTVAEKSKVDIRLNFKQFDFNKPVTFPFSIPKSYKVR